MVISALDIHKVPLSLVTGSEAKYYWFVCTLNLQVIHRTSVPNALAVDWIGKNLYWCDAERKTLEVAKANGLYPTILISSGLQNPSSLTLDPLTG